MGKKDQTTEFEKLKKDIQTYNEKLLNKQLLIIFSDVEIKHLKQVNKTKPKNIQKLQAIELAFKKENFAHLAGVEKKSYTSLSISATEFYDKLLNGEIEANNCKFSKFRNLKENIFTNLPNIFRSISIVGKYDYHKQDLDVEKVIGNTKEIAGAVLGISKVNSKIENPLISRYFPKSLLNSRTQDLILLKTERLILYIFEKTLEEKEYSKLLFKHKDFYIDNIYNTKEFYDKLSNELKEKIKADIGIPSEKKIEEKNEKKVEEKTEKKITVAKSKWSKKLAKDKEVDLEIDL